MDDFFVFGVRRRVKLPAIHGARDRDETKVSLVRKKQLLPGSSILRYLVRTKGYFPAPGTLAIYLLNTGPVLLTIRMVKNEIKRIYVREALTKNKGVYLGIDAKMYELVNNVCVNFSLAWVKSVPNCTLFC